MCLIGAALPSFCAADLMLQAHLPKSVNIMLLNQAAFHPPCPPFRIHTASSNSPLTQNTSASCCNSSKLPKHVKIFNTTLRDGLLLNPTAITTTQKLRAAEQLAKLRVDVIEAGFPTLSPENFATTHQIASTVGNLDNPPTICSLSTASEKDIETSYEAVKSARFPRIHVYLPTPLCGDLTDRAREQLVVKTQDVITFAASLCDDIEFSPMNATSLFISNPSFLRHLYAQAIKAGASTVSVPDSSGKASPALYVDLIHYLRTNVTDIDKATISVHAHDGKETGLANSIAAVTAGVRQIECTVLDIGEGMAALEDIFYEIQALSTKEDGEGMYTMRISDEEIEPTC